MSSCAAIDPFVTAYIDGEAGHETRQLVEEHLRRCPPCRSRVDAERAASALLKARRPDLCATAAPAHLRDRCCSARLAAAAVSIAGVQARRARRLPRPSLALAASVLIILASAATYRFSVGATRAIAAELTADHLKCFMLNGVLRTHDSVEEAERFLRASFDWPVELPEHPDRAGMQLVGSRWCLYEHGKVAHVMYKHRGVPVSIFMLPGTSRERSLTRAFGHDAVVWAEGQRTFVLIAKAPRAEVEQLAVFAQQTMH